MRDFSDKVALVTGASSGLGMQISKLLAESGATVVLTGRKEEQLESLVEEISKLGGKVSYYILDITDDSQIKDVIHRVGEEVGPISILVNNAGVLSARLSMTMSLDIIDELIGTNLKGPFLVAREVARQMKECRIEGRIVNVSSMAAFNFSGSGLSLYSITKAALIRMTEVFAVEWAEYGINVNAIAPGIFYSNMTKSMLLRGSEDLQAKFPRKRIIKTNQLDSALLFLCSDSSECVTGTVIKIDDGQESR